VQAHLEHAPTDEAWLAKVRARAADRAGSEWRRKAEEELFRRWAELAETEGLELLLRGERQRRFRMIVDDWPVLPEPGAIPPWISRLRAVGASVASAGIAAGVVFALHGVGQVALALAMPSVAVLLVGWAAVAVFRVRR
jgi:hypothetical protein